MATDFDPLAASLGLNLPPIGAQKPIVHHRPSSLRVGLLSAAAVEAVLARFAEDACFLGYGECATEELVRARAALEGPVACGRAAGSRRNASRDAGARMQWEIASSPR